MKTVKKTTKRMLCVCLCICMLSALILPAFATTEEDTDNYSFLLKQGYTDEFLNDQTENYLQQMVDAIGDYEIGNIKTTVTELNDGNIATISTISKSLLTLEITAAELYKSGSNQIATILVSVSWQWAANKPVYRGKDAVSVNWDNTVFAYANGFYQEDLYKSDLNDNWTTFKTYDTAAEATQGGLGSWTDLKGLKKYVGGAMLFVLAPATPIYKGSAAMTTINVDYAHAAVPLSGLSIDVAGFGIGLNWNYSCSTLSASHTIRYSK